MDQKNRKKEMIFAILAIRVQKGLHLKEESK